MRKIAIRVLCLIYLMLISCQPLFGQTPTLVSGTIKDVNGLPYSNASVSAQLIGIPPGLTATILVNGNPTQIGGQQNASANSSGVFTMNLFCNSAGGGCSVISPATTQWQITVTTNGALPPLGTGPQACTATLTISGSSQSISSSFSACPALSAGGTGGVGAGSGTFTWSTACSGPSCFQGVDDDSTDNCGSALTAWLSSINSYAGPGIPQVFIWGSGAGKAYKLATANCVLSFTLARGVALHLHATLDCAQAAASCIQLGPVHTPGGAAAYTQQSLFSVDGGGSLAGGASLAVGSSGQTSAGGIYVEPQVNVFKINHIFFFGTGASTGWGANNATLGNCSNWAVFIDFPVGSGVVSDSYVTSNTSSSTSGACSFGNPNGVGTGSNTVMFDNNLLGTAGNVAPGNQCGSVGIYDGGTLGTMSNNNIYGYGIPIDLTGQGHKISLNQLDSANCTSNGVTAAIQIGASGTSAAVGPASFTANVGQFYPGHANQMLAIAGGSTATLQGATLVANMSAPTGGALFPSTLNCTPLDGLFCEVSKSANMIVGTAPCGTVNSGWLFDKLAAQCLPAAATANTTATTLYTPAPTKTVTVNCQVVLTTPATTSSTLPQCQVTYTDFFSNTSVTTILTPVWAATTAGCSGSTTNTLGNSCQGGTTIAPKGGTAVQYSTINYASTGATPMAYTLNVTALTQ